MGGKETECDQRDILAWLTQPIFCQAGLLLYSKHWRNQGLRQTNNWSALSAKTPWASTNIHLCNKLCQRNQIWRCEQVLGREVQEREWQTYDIRQSGGIQKGQWLRLGLRIAKAHMIVCLAIICTKHGRILPSFKSVAIRNVKIADSNQYYHFNQTWNILDKHLLKLAKFLFCWNCRLGMWHVQFE